MQWNINELSLAGQFEDPAIFRAALEPLLRLRAANRLVGERLYVSRVLAMRPVTAQLQFGHAVRELRDADFTKLVLSWLTRQGLFWEDERQPNEDDYFEYEGADVTDHGLGEAARRMLANIPCGAFSFVGTTPAFDANPLVVQQGLREEPIGFVQVENHWTVQTLEAAATNARGAPKSWKEVMERTEEQFDGLIFSKEILHTLERYPFSGWVTERIFDLLAVLQRLVEESDEEGKFSEEGQRLYADHFFGDKAWFSDESSTNYFMFEKEMTFPDPSGSGEKLFCPWHGKIKTPQFRVHFEWPRPRGQRQVKVVYIGPKITKR